MLASELKQKLLNHSGEFHCLRRGGDEGTKLVQFRHDCAEPGLVEDVPDLAGMRDFYSSFGDTRLYFHPESGDAAYFIATLERWDGLRENFLPWIEMIDEDERDEFIPRWVDGCIVVGEIPSSGNYLLVPSDGDKAGHVFEFQHDGFEFTELGSDLCTFVANALNPDRELLGRTVAYMTFSDEDSDAQWGVAEMRDNDGRVVSAKS